MAVWTAPTTRSTGALVSASIWNTDIVENLKYLKDSPVFDGDISVGDDLFLTSTGAVINFASGDVTITHSTNTLTFAGAASGYVFSGSGISVNNTGVVTSGFIDFLKGAAWDALGYVDGTSSLAIGGYRSSQWNTLVFYTNGTEKMRLTSGGNLAIAESARIYLDGVAGTGDTYFTESSANTIAVFCGGTERVGFNASGVYVNTYPTTANAANLWSQNGSNIHISTSSIRYKHAVETLDAVEAQAALMAMRPVTYRGKTDTDQRRFVGFIAEEMMEIAPLLCTYDHGGESGTPSYVTYDRVTAYLVAVVQQQQAEIDALKARFN